MKALWIVLLLSLPVAAQPLASGSASPSAGSGQQSAAQAQEPMEAAGVLVDRVFGIRVKALGLERSVQMLQWRKADQPAPAHFEMAWTDEPIDSYGFDAAHRNGHHFPFNGQRWRATGATLGGHPVSSDVLDTLDDWSEIKPDLSQLPTNLAVSLQPDGEWLSNSQDPAHPRIGDLQVRWNVVADAPAPPGSVLVAGRWKLPAKQVASIPTPGPSTTKSLSPQFAKTVPPGLGDDAGRAWIERAGIDPVGWFVVGGSWIALVLLVSFLQRESDGKPEPRKRRRKRL